MNTTQLQQDAYKLLDHAKMLGLSGDMQAAKLFCDFVLKKDDDADDNKTPLDLTDQQALEIANIADGK